MTACLLYAKIHKNKAENLLHLMLYFSHGRKTDWKPLDFCMKVRIIRVGNAIRPNVFTT